MKRTPLLHAELSQVIGALGHGDSLLIGDAGMPVPAGPRRIDLALTAGIPSVADVLKTVLLEMQVEHAVIANEAPDRNGGGVPVWGASLAGAPPQPVPHEELKRLSAGAKAVVRTGEFTPYANILLVAGVVF